MSKKSKNFIFWWNFPYIHIYVHIYSFTLRSYNAISSNTLVKLFFYQIYQQVAQQGQSGYLHAIQVPLEVKLIITCQVPLHLIVLKVPASPIVHSTLRNVLDFQLLKTTIHVLHTMTLTTLWIILVKALEWTTTAAYYIAVSIEYLFIPVQKQTMNIEYVSMGE